MLFFIIPIGAERGIRNIPFVTISIIAVCFVVWIGTESNKASDIERIMKIDERLSQIEREILKENWFFTLDPAARQEAREMIRSGEVIDKDSYEYEKWEKTYNELEEAIESFVFNRLGFRPAKPTFLTLITSLFVHGGFFHLFFNMVFLWLVGVNMEDVWGREIFTGLYLSGGILATLTHAMFYPSSPIPLVGASGAIAAVMGAFMVRHFTIKIRFFYFFLFFLRPILGTFTITAGYALPFWVLFQVFGALTVADVAGVAYWAHLGGFLIGSVIGYAFFKFKVEDRYIKPRVEGEYIKMDSRLTRAYELLESNRKEEAIRLFKESLAGRDNPDVAWELARLVDDKAKPTFYNHAISSFYTAGIVKNIVILVDEMKESNIEINEKNNYAVGEAYYRSKKNEEALKYFAKVSKGQSPCAPRSLLRIAQIMKQQGKLDEVKKIAAYLKEKFPDAEESFDIDKIVHGVR